MKVRRNFVIGMLILLIAAAVGWISITNHFNFHKDKTVWITQDGVCLYKIPLYEGKPLETVTVTGENGAENVICMENETVWMEHASCPDGLCIKTGTITKTMTPIICLPNKVMIQIKEEGVV